MTKIIIKINQLKKFKINNKKLGINITINYSELKEEKQKNSFIKK